MTRIYKTILEAGVPQRIPGQYSAIRTISGTLQSLKIYDKHPNKTNDSSVVRELEHNGINVVHRWDDAWLLLETAPTVAGTRELVLELYTGPIGLVEASSEELTHWEVNATLQGFSLSTGGFALLAAFDRADGNVQAARSISRESYLSGQITATGAFHVEWQCAMGGLGFQTMVAARSRNMGGGIHTLMLDTANWDHAWAKSAPTTWAGFPQGTRLPFGANNGYLLGLQNNAGAGIIVDYIIGSRSR
jgi:hypothetical protein